MIMKKPCYGFWVCLYIAQPREDRLLRLRYQTGDENARDIQDQDGRMTCEEDFNISKVNILSFNEWTTRNHSKLNNKGKARVERS